MPLGSLGAPVFIAGLGLTPVPMAKLSIPFNQPSRYRISGVTKDSTGAALGNCGVDIFETGSRRFVGSTISDASGNYSLDVTVEVPCFGVFYLAGAPDVAGTTVNTLVGVP
jgi:hypothetical protein